MNIWGFICWFQWTRNLSESLKNHVCVQGLVCFSGEKLLFSWDASRSWAHNVEDPISGSHSPGLHRGFQENIASPWLQSSPAPRGEGSKDADPAHSNAQFTGPCQRPAWNSHLNSETWRLIFFRFLVKELAFGARPQWIFPLLTWACSHFLPNTYK